MALHCQASVQTIWPTARRAICWLRASAYHDIVLLFHLALSVSVDVSRNVLPNSRLLLVWPICPLCLILWDAKVLVMCIMLMQIRVSIELRQHLLL